jgi:hypothetical protein
MSYRGPALALVMLLLSGCGGVAGPRWHGDAVRWLETYREQALAGETGLAPGAFANALREFRRGGDWDGLATAHLTRCAVERVIDHPTDACAAYREQKPLGASPSHDAYARWLDGSITVEDVGLLPAAYREVAVALLANDRAALAGKIEGIVAPMSRLVALAVVWRQLPNPQPALFACQSLASQQGWQAAHRACLGRELEILRERGDHLGVQEREKRLRLLGP